MAGLTFLVGLSVAPVTLVEVDFDGSGALGAIASSDSQFTAFNPAVTFDDPSTAFAAIGGGAGTSSWVYDGTGAAATGTDLHGVSTFGAPSRFDLDLGLAASGF